MSRNKGPRDDRWYLNLMAPNTKGPKFAWLDPTSIYINGEAFHDLLDDLVADLEGLTIDVVGGLDAMGFVLGSALATRLGVGFLPIRKAGKPLLEQAELVDRYEGEQVAAGSCSQAFRLRYRDPERTLTDEDVERVHAAVQAALEKQLGAQLRA